MSKLFCRKCYNELEIDDIDQGEHEKTTYYMCKHCGMSLIVREQYNKKPIYLWSFE